MMTPLLLPLVPLDPAVQPPLGPTPLVRLRQLVTPGSAEVWVKLESRNPTGSHKDRVARALLEDELARGRVRPGDRIVTEAGASAGLALALAARASGLRLTLVSSNAFCAARLAAMRALGAEVVLEPSGDGAITPDLRLRMRRRALALAARPGCLYLEAFAAPVARIACAAIGREIAQALGGVDLVCAAAGSGAALSGALDGLAEAGLHPQAVVLEPAQAGWLSTGRGGGHRIEGTGIAVAPPLLVRERLAGVLAVDQDQAFAMARRLACEEGLGVGASSGLNIVAALDLARRLGPGRRVVTWVCADPEPWWAPSSGRPHGTRPAGSRPGSA